jgi:hypothetical protein
MVMDVRSFGDAENEKAASGGGRTVVSAGCLRRLVLEPVMGWPRMEEVREFSHGCACCCHRGAENCSRKLEMFIELLVVTGIVDAFHRG